MEINKIYQKDCIEGLKELDENSIDCVWTDPPYNINYKYDQYKDKRIDYFEWCNQWLSECYRVLKPKGSIFVKMWSRYIFEFGNLLLANKFKFKNVIVWKRKSCANYDDKFLGGYEVIFFFTKEEDNKFIAEGFLRDTQFLKRWDGTKEYKGRLNDLWDDIKPVTAGNLIHPEGIYVEGTGKKEHPAQHPEELVERSIKCATNEGEVCYKRRRSVLQTKEIWSWIYLWEVEQLQVYVKSLTETLLDLKYQTIMLICLTKDYLN